MCRKSQHVPPSPQEEETYALSIRYDRGFRSVIIFLFAVPYRPRKALRAPGGRGSQVFRLSVCYWNRKICSVIDISQCARQIRILASVTVEESVFRTQPRLLPINLLLYTSSTAYSSMKLTLRAFLVQGAGSR
jgi:hypothetical protein